MIRNEELTRGRSISLTIAQWKELERRREFYDLSLSWFVRRAVKNYLEDDGVEMPRSGKDQNDADL